MLSLQAQKLILLITNYELGLSRDLFIDLYSKNAHSSESGSKFEYSNIGYELLGLLTKVKPWQLNLGILVKTLFLQAKKLE